jgi:hypothetical protein
MIPGTLRFGLPEQTGEVQDHIQQRCKMTVILWFMTETKVPCGLQALWVDKNKIKN